MLDILHWRWMFWFVPPIALLALIAGAVLIRNVTESRPIPLDVFGGAVRHRFRV